jgi:hypothetical protein
LTSAILSYACDLRALLLEVSGGNAKFLVDAWKCLVGRNTKLLVDARHSYLVNSSHPLTSLSQVKLVQQGWPLQALYIEYINWLIFTLPKAQLPFCFLSPNKEWEKTCYKSILLSPKHTYEIVILVQH